MTFDLISYDKSLLAGKKIFDIKISYFSLDREIFGYNFTENAECYNHSSQAVHSLVTVCLDMNKVKRDLFKISSYNSILIYVMRCDPSESKVSFNY